MELRGLELAGNWTSAAGALEGVLGYLGVPLPRHAIMGLTGHAWHTCLGTREGVVALPSGPSDLDWEAMVRRYARTGVEFERFGGELPESADWTEMRGAAVDWVVAHLTANRPVIGWDFHLHEFGIVYGYDREREGFLVHDILSGEVGPLAAWADWPSAVGRIELFAPGRAVEVDAVEAVGGALETALGTFQGLDGPADGQPRGTAGLTAWAEAMGGEAEIDRAGNAYTLAVLQAARMDGADFLSDVAGSLPALAAPLRDAERALRAEVQALAPLITLFPFPTGGHGNVANAGLRRGAAMALQRAATQEHRAAAAVAEALALLESD